MFKHKNHTYNYSCISFFSNSFMYAESINDEEVFIKNGSRDKKLIALTFDDGPHPKETNQVLDVLNKYNVKGTFLQLENMLIGIQPLVRASKEGHEIGNHTFNHPDITNLTNAQLEEEILKCEEILIKLTGKSQHYLDHHMVVINKKNQHRQQKNLIIKQYYGLLQMLGLAKSSCRSYSK